MIASSQRTCLADLPLCPEDHECLRRQGFVAGERRIGATYYKLRFRRGQQQVVLGIGTSREAAERIRQELQELQRPRLAERQLHCLSAAARKSLRESKRQLEPLLAGIGHKFHGNAIRQRQAAVVLPLSDRVADAHSCRPRTNESPSAAAIDQRPHAEEGVPDEQHHQRSAPERRGVASGGRVRNGQDRVAVPIAAGKDPAAPSGDARVARYAAGLSRTDCLRPAGALSTSEVCHRPVTGHGQIGPRAARQTVTRHQATAESRPAHRAVGQARPADRPRQPAAGLSPPGGGGISLGGRPPSERRKNGDLIPASFAPCSGDGGKTNGTSHPAYHFAASRRKLMAAPSQKSRAQKGRAQEGRASRPRPYWVPPGVDLDQLPDELRVAIEGIVNPAYEQLVLQASPGLEASAGMTIVYLLWQEVLEQVQLDAPGIGGDDDPDARKRREAHLDRYLRLAGAKNKVSSFLLRIHNHRIKWGDFPGIVDPLQACAAENMAKGPQ